MKNGFIILPLIFIEWEKGKKTCVTVGWFNWTYSFNF